MDNIFDPIKIKKAWDAGDIPALMELFDNGFEQTEIDEATPPNNPRKRSKSEYMQMAQGGIKNGAKMDVYNIVPGKDRAAYSFTCHMPNGVKMVGNVIVEIQNGKIVKETTIQAKEK